MINLQLAARTAQRNRQAREGQLDDSAPVATARRDLDGWACGFGESTDPHANERCDGIVPELIIELI